MISIKLLIPNALASSQKLLGEFNYFVFQDKNAQKSVKVKHQV